MSGDCRSRKQESSKIQDREEKARGALDAHCDKGKSGFACLECVGSESLKSVLCSCY
jgi:hypothetical protein